MGQQAALGSELRDLGSKCGHCRAECLLSLGVGFIKCAKQGFLMVEHEMALKDSHI